ncbi:hypothetical protein CXX84_10505 [Arthrobacter sp. AFG7.2]|nr:hypothetical protein CXX84_10505 [Arthrobacter sp. AFG7.2]
MVPAFMGGVFFSTYLLTKGSYGLGIAVLLAAGVAGGALVRALAQENLVSVLFVLVVVAECMTFSQLGMPWPTLWPVLIPGNAIGVMVGSIVRETLRENRPRNVREMRSNEATNG